MCENAYTKIWNHARKFALLFRGSNLDLISLSNYTEIKITARFKK